MNEHQLELFCAVVERGSFSLASRQLFISQPALSIQIRRLEKALGVQLLTRFPNGVTPTPAGRELYNAGSSILEQSRAIERRLQSVRSGEAGSLAIGASHTGAMYFLTDLVPAFTATHPNVKVTIAVEAAPRMFERIHSGGLDAGLEWDPVLPSTLEATALFSERFHVFGSARHYGRAACVVSRGEFEEKGFIGLNYGIGTPSYLDVWLVEHNLPPRKVTRLPSIDAIKRMVEADLGLTILSGLSAERDLQAGYLVRLEMEGFQMERSLDLLTAPQVHSVLLSRFVSFTRDFALSR
ncbi:MAG: LysR family transcriptional regulator [Chloroflexota bacterium]